MKKIVIFLYFLCASLYVTYPLIFRLKDSLPGLGDELLITWILNWDIYAFTNFPLNIFNANIYYPFQNSLSFSDTHFISALIAFIPVKLLGEPTVAYNINLILSFAMLGFFTYLLLRILTKDDFSSMIGGTLVAFSTYTLGKTMHLQLISIQWIPLSLLFFCKFLKTGEFKNLVWSSIFFVVQAYNSFLPGYFLIVCFLSLGLVYAIKNKSFIKKLLSLRFTLLLLMVILALLPIIHPYIRTSSDFSYVRDIRDSIHTGNRPEYFFYSYGKTRLTSILNDLFYKNDKGPYFYDGYLGLAFIILSAIAIFYRIHSGRKKLHIFFDSFLVIGFVGFILSLGPALQWGGKVIKYPFMIPLPYALAYYVLPGFKGFRNSGRWEMLTVFAFSVMIGLFMAVVFKKRSSLFKMLVTGFVCLAILLEASFPLSIEKLPKRSEFPKVYSYFKNLENKDPIIELPIYNWNVFPYSSIELKRQYYSTLHFHPMINGGSGFSPPSWQRNTYMFMLSFPDNTTVSYLRKIGVRYIVLHKDEYERLEKDNYKIGETRVVTWQNIQATIKLSPKIKFITQFDNNYVYEIVNI